MDKMKKVLKLADVNKALSDPTRLKIVLLLNSAKTLCVNAIAHRVGITQPAVSQQLKILKNAGIIEAEKTGLFVHYRVNDKVIKEYIKDLSGIFHEGEKQECVKCPE